MEYNLESPVCIGCGLVGVSFGTCPRCLFCTFCKTEGHLAVSCADAPVFKICSQEDRSTTNCTREAPQFQYISDSWLDSPDSDQETLVSNHSTNLDEWLDNSDNDAHTDIPDIDMPTTPVQMESPRAKSIQSHYLNLTIRGFNHGDMELEARNITSISLSLDCDVQFPVSIGDVIEEISTSLVQSKKSFLGACRYSEIIQENGGVNCLVSAAMLAVDKEMINLQGKVVTANELQAILRRQSSTSWSHDVGYLSFITDDRVSSYFRVYVGQSARSKTRLVNEHGWAIRTGKKTTLHHYICWRGDGRRSANFLRLWTIPSSIPGGDWRNTISNVLEIAFCFAFASLPSTVLADYCDISTRPKADLGLNVMNPLIQGMCLSPRDKAFWVTKLSQSADPEVRHWLEAKQQKLRSDTQVNATYEDYEMALRQGIGGDAAKAWLNSVSTPIMTSISQKRASEDLFVKLNELLGSGFVQPSGSLSAKIGFVSSFIPNDEVALGEEARQSQPNLHRGFRDMGFNEANSLAWTFDFCERRQLQASSFKPIKPGSPLANNIALAHRLLIERSEISIIFLCGPDAELYALGLAKDLKRAKLNLQGATFTIFLQPQQQWNRPRLYIRTPDVPTGVWQFSLGHASLLGNIIKFATVLTETPQVKPFYLECGFALRYMAIQFGYEKRGYEKITSNDLSPGIRTWLARRGIDKWDIPKLKSLTNNVSITAGLLLLVHSIKERILRTDHEPAKETDDTVHVHDEVELAIEELIQDNSRSILIAARLISDWVETKYVTILNLSGSAVQKKVIESEHNEIINLNRFNYPHNIESETFLDRIEEGADASSSRLEINTRSVLSSSSLKMRYLPSCKPPNCWRDEKYNYQHRGYRYRVNYHPGHSAVRVGKVEIFLRLPNDDRPDEVTVFIEISPPGVRHRNVFALNAATDDVASRVAFFIVTKKRSFYAFSNGENPAIFRTNALADRILKGATDEEIAALPRRFLQVYSNRNPRLKMFLRPGTYTSAW